MKGRVVFWYFLHLPFCEGYVQFKLYGQQCMRCNNGIFEPAMWYPEEVNKVLCNLYNRIGQVSDFPRPAARIKGILCQPITNLFPKYHMSKHSRTCER